jgi:hypothetical protein
LPAQNRAPCSARILSRRRSCQSGPNKTMKRNEAIRTAECAKFSYLLAFDPHHRHSCSRRPDLYQLHANKNAHTLRLAAGAAVAERDLEIRARSQPTKSDWSAPTGPRPENDISIPSRAGGPSVRRTTWRLDLDRPRGARPATGRRLRKQATEARMAHAYRDVATAAARSQTTGSPVCQSSRPVLRAGSRPARQ